MSLEMLHAGPTLLVVPGSTPVPIDWDTAHIAGQDLIINATTVTLPVSCKGAKSANVQNAKGETLGTASLGLALECAAGICFLGGEVVFTAGAAPQSAPVVQPVVPPPAPQPAPPKTEPADDPEHTN
ncbi:MAG: hypothetical protein KGL39_17110 [Patescibacteria group bacterium]|nr:hypothetical protein [Patescibacteria group bacterium]